MELKKKIVLAFALVVCALSPRLQAQEISAEALNAILEAADGICGEYFLEGKTSKQEFSGAADGQLKGLTKAFAELGLAGDFELSTEEYINVLHGELGSEVKDIRSCKLAVWDDLKAAVITE